MASVLAMMFLVIFGSLAAAMAVVAQGNLRTADSAMKVSRAMSAAETGLVFAIRRLASESRRFVVHKGVIDGTYGHDLWLGTYNQALDGAVTVLPPEGYTEGTLPAGVMDAVFNAHLADRHTLILDPADAALPEIDGFGTLRVRPIALTAMPDGAGGFIPSPVGPYFRLKYELIDGAPYVRVTSQGVDGQGKDGEITRTTITRTLQMDFRIDKKIEYAVLSSSRIMIGKNVRVEGPLGSRYGFDVPEDLDTVNGDPLVMRSDFYHLHPALDARLDIFFTRLADYDADGDGRLRVYHPDEAAGIIPPLVDHDQDEYVDDYDLFLDHYDTNPTDGMVVYDPALASLAGLGLLADEFADDDQLGSLIDDAVPDRNGDGSIGDAVDTALGYHNGVIDANDVYTKVRGRLAFAVARVDWEVAQGGESYQTVVRGPIQAGIDKAPVTFEMPVEQLRELTTDMLTNAQAWFEAQVPVGSADFDAQVVAGGGTGPLTWESSPYLAQGAYDYIERPVYQDMTFTNVRIPKGTNGLFENCTFIGVTFIETEPDCTDINWNYVGAKERIEDPPGTFTYQDKYPGLTAMLGVTVLTDTKPHSNNIRFHSCTFIGSIAATTPMGYAHWRNKIQLTGNTRFYIDPDDPDLATQPDAAAILTIINGMNLDDLDELAKSSILVPGWSADMGSFTNDQSAKVKLKGTIIAGILDVRGTADVHGTLMMTFQPIVGEGPLFYGGLTDAFNTTIGYFGPAAGDGEGIDPSDPLFNGFGQITLRYDPDAKLPDGIPWPIKIAADPLTYTEGGSM
ncbi:MAG: hypothetical protein IH888_00470 [Planctomycetes bacterium]|nr:hypothetical protein [Planctomycetota bacterium]